jgi:hypothetical protein
VKARVYLILIAVAILVGGIILQITGHDFSDHIIGGIAILGGLAVLINAILDLTGNGK